MTIRPGEPWGQTVAMPADAIVVQSDVALADAIARREPRPILIRGGDLYATLGAPSATTEATLVSIDTIGVRADDRDLMAVSHVVARGAGRRGWWRGPLVAVMNVDHLGPWDVAPRAHPNDGRLNVVEVAASMSARKRWQAARRLPTGTHVPHPSIAMRTAAAAQFDFDRPLALWLDGERRGSVRSLTAIVMADAATVYV